MTNKLLALRKIGNGKFSCGCEKGSHSLYELREIEDHTVRGNIVYSLNYYCNRNNMHVAGADIMEHEVDKTSKVTNTIRSHSDNERLIAEGRRFDQKDQNYNKKTKPVSFFLLSGIVSGMIGFGLSGGKLIQNWSWEAYLCISYFLGSLVIAALILKKFESKQATGFELNMMELYKAYKFLDDFINNRPNSQLKKVREQVELLLRHLKIRNGNPLKRKPSLISLSPIHNLINKIEFNLIPAIQDPETNAKQLQNTLLDLMECFLSDDFGKISETVEKLNIYQEIKTKTIFQKIRANRDLYNVVIVSVSIVIGGIVTGVSSITFTHLTDDGRLIAWIGVTALTAGLWYKKWR